MAVYTIKRDYDLAGRMSKDILDDHIRQAVSESGIREGYAMVFVAGCVAALAVTEADRVF